jgi:hypothetical protein
MRQFLALLGLFVLVSCASEPSPAASGGGLAQFLTGLPDEGPSFGIATLQEAPPEPGYAAFNKSDPSLAASHAEQICTLGYQRLGDETAPGEQVPFTETRIRCNAYRLSF